MRPASLLLKLAVLVPLIYFGVLIVGGLMTPGYDHARQYASELGMAGAPAAQLFNYGIVAAGVCAILGGLGVFLGLQRLGAGVVWALLSAICIAAWGAAMVLGGLHPMPDPLHNGYMLGLAIIPAPLLVFFGLAGRSSMGGLKAFLILTFLATVVFNLAMFNIGGLNLVKVANVGFWQRGYALATIPWIGIAALCIDQALAARAARDRDAAREALFSSP